MDKKKELRKQIKALKNMHASSNAQQSVDIMAALEKHPLFKSANIILLYHSLPDEVYTHAFLEKWYNRKQLLLPVVVGDELELRRFSSPNDLQVGAYNIQEPVGECFNDFSAIELVVVPGMAFDKQGHRLGRGKGYYDRLLPKLTNAYKLGVCFPYQYIEEVPTDEHDIRMDEVLTIG
jgi:5-formyltetrahydrofolate cyclo-ligase